LIISKETVSIGSLVVIDAVHIPFGVRVLACSWRPS
jgi:hypothetical protein